MKRSYDTFFKSQDSFIGQMKVASGIAFMTALSCQSEKKIIEINFSFRWAKDDDVNCIR